MRVSYCYACAIRTASLSGRRCVCREPAEGAAGPESAGSSVSRSVSTDAMGMFESMHARHNNKPRVRSNSRPRTCTGAPTRR